MEIVEIVVYLTAALAVGFLVLNFISDAATMDPPEIPPDHIRADSTTFVGKALEFYVSCGNGKIERTSSFYLEGSGTYSKEDFFDSVNGLSLCNTFRSERYGCGESENVNVNYGRGIPLPHVVKLRCDPVTMRFIIEADGIATGCMDDVCSAPTETHATCPEDCAAPCTDMDGDGYGTGSERALCLHPEEDCDGSKAAVNPGAVEDCATLFDDDCDGNTNEGCVGPCTDTDGDGYDSCAPGDPGDDGLTRDCDDGAAGINPGGTETCGNGIDENCIPGDDSCAAAGGLLKVHPTNKRYFTDDSGKAIYMTGSHTWYAIHKGDHRHVFSYSRTRFNAYLDYMQGFGHNFLRMWSGLSTITCPPFPWRRTGPGTATDGGLKFDVTQFDQAYFDMLKVYIQDLDDRGMYGSIMIFGSHNVMKTDTDGSAWGESNNINSLGISDGNTFFSPQADIREAQKRLIRKFIDELNHFDNIVWEIMNEPGSASASWYHDMVDYVISYEATKPKQHLVGMTGGYSLGTAMLSGNHDWISPDIYSMGYYEGGSATYSNKIVISDTDHIRNPTNTGWGFSELMFINDMRKWVWKTFARGNHPIFMDSYDSYMPEPERGQTSGGINTAFDPIRKAMGKTLSYANRFESLADTLPSQSASLCSTTYCMVNVGKDYLFYQPNPGAFTAQVAAGTYEYEWYNAKTGAVTSTGTETYPGGSVTFTRPFTDDAVLYLWNH